MPLKILYVDDQHDIRILAKIAMETGGVFLVDDYPSGEEALDNVEESRPDIIILDVVMPGLTGPQVLEKLRAMPSLADTPVIFLTSSIAPEDVGLYHRMDIIGVIPKPFDPFVLAQEIRVLWDAYRRICRDIR